MFNGFQRTAHHSRTDRCLPWVMALTCFAVFAERSDAASGDFTETILPIFKEHCSECHAGAKPKARLDFSSPASALRGLKNGPVIVPGDADGSTLWQVLAADEMPPEKPLDPALKDVILAWIKDGAPGLKPSEEASPKPNSDAAADPAVDLTVESEQSVSREGWDHWAFVAPVRTDAPEVREAALARTDVDRFIEQALEAKGLTLSEEADRVTLIRRVAFDLTGLPPAPAEIALYLTDAADDAYERMVDRYLDSPRYGERWGRRWLDAAGYADSNGYFDADSERPLAHRYRDYVIRAFNDDMPFDRFVREQLAGDEIAGLKPDGDVTPEMVDAITATHFLRNAPDGTGESDGNDQERQNDRFAVLEGTLDITASALLGLTVRCARCHDHKFDPITQAEYYRMGAIFSAAYPPDPERWLKPKERVIEIGTREERERAKKLNHEIDARVKSFHKGLAAIADPLRDKIAEAAIEAIEEPEREAVRAARATVEKERNGEQKELLKKHAEQLEPDDDALAKMDASFASLRDGINEKIAEAEKERPEPIGEIAALFETRPDAPPFHLLKRGDHAQPGRAVQPGVPAVLCAAGGPFEFAPPGEGAVSSGRRLAFANWMTSPANPLFARVMVNRVWQHHFGQGIVPTPGNFGRSGTPPINPALLDYLATEFPRAGWSIKALHRLIMNSAAYRQSSADAEAGLAADPDNRLLWHYPIQRLDAEAVRDAMLAVGGGLDLTMYGPCIDTKRDGNTQVVLAEDAPGAMRRSIYLRQRRSSGLSFLEVFDCPAMVTNVAQRSTSTVALQSLALLNSDFVMARAMGFARRLVEEAGGTDDARVSLAFLLTTGRGPTMEEREASMKFLAEQPALYAGQDDAPLLGLRDFCQMLLASNAFLYLE